MYCAVDPEMYYPETCSPPRWDLGYLGTYSADRQPPLERLMLEPARRLSSARFVVAGAQYPESVQWPPNVQRIHHLPPAEHRRFYNEQAFTLNITRADMIRAGYSPSVRLFEAAACGVPIITDEWPGLATFFRPHHEILVARCAADTLLPNDTPVSAFSPRRCAAYARNSPLAASSVRRKSSRAGMGSLKRMCATSRSGRR